MLQPEALRMGDAGPGSGGNRPRSGLQQDRLRSANSLMKDVRIPKGKSAQGLSRQSRSDFALPVDRR
ncbi:hypothetical protein RHECNPAF_2330085 [Rhizobium etli CNPAF512]|nr:hypothetical protein RHECNPAF_2330085 [Rhizobium etli CNPAF512]